MFLHAQLLHHPSLAPHRMGHAGRQTLTVKPNLPPAKQARWRRVTLAILVVRAAVKFPRGVKEYTRPIIPLGYTLRELRNDCEHDRSRLRRDNLKVKTAQPPPPGKITVSAPKRPHAQPVKILALHVPFSEASRVHRTPPRRPCWLLWYVQ